jgi:23S rRNA (cytosine1962-C5)-methyltransferase
LKLLSPGDWKDYQLIDSGNFEKLERFGAYFLIRPEPQAIWNTSMPADEWDRMANAWFKKEKNDPEKGRWMLRNDMPEQWLIKYDYKAMHIRLRLGLTAFRHIGVFPEQADNWNYIYDSLTSMHLPKQRVLNLFAYTGGASLAARAASAEVVHVDSVKPVINWARENMESSGLTDIRWVVEDALKFARREARRESIYNGIILDPPAYGRGADGEKWILEENLNELIQLCQKILSPKKGFLLVNLYSMGFSALVLENLINSYFPDPVKKETGEIFLPDKFGKRLPLGTFLRFQNFSLKD